jgi:hypothetical protein
MRGRDSGFDASLYSFESASGAETISEIELGVRASKKAKGCRKDWQLLAQLSIIVQNDEREDIMRWEGA